MIKSSDREGPRVDMSASTLAIDIDALTEQFEAMKAAERDRCDFIETLLGLVQSLKSDRLECTKALRAQEMLAHTYQDRFEAVEGQLHELQRAVDCDMFVLVIVDGDSTLFRDDYVRDGIQGGQRAAQDLQQALFDYFKDKTYFKHDHKIITKIYLNLGGLAKTYNDMSVVSTPLVFQQFVQGFNKVHDLMAIVDAGNGKEGADSKIKAEFNLLRRNLHCKQLVVAGSGDNGYGSFLRPYAPVLNKSETITLIEALPFAPELRALSSKFETVRFENLFRNTKLAVKSTQQQNDAMNPVPSTVEPSITLPATYANKVLASDPISEVSKAVPEEQKAATTNKFPRLVYVNQFSQRIDQPIKNLDNNLALRLKHRKLCNKYHLLGSCDHSFCVYDHDSKLNAVELENLRFVARLTPCGNGLKCEDPDCINGHRCQKGPRCTNWKTRDCRFSNAMHEVDASNFKVASIGA